MWSWARGPFNQCRVVFGREKHCDCYMVWALNQSLLGLGMVQEQHECADEEHSGQRRLQSYDCWLGVPEMMSSTHQLGLMMKYFLRALSEHLQTFSWFV